MDPIKASQPIDIRRAQLQSALLKKIVEANQVQTVEVERATVGKGNVIDIRV